MIEKTMEVDRMEDVISVFGSFDQNLRMIETEYNVRVTDRDEQIHITGEAENVLYAEKAIAGLLSLAAKGEEIGEQNVRYIFRLVREGREQKIQELAGDVVCITAKGKPIKAKTLGQKKYVEAMPLYRQEQMWKRMGVALKRGTMANWVIQVADLYLRPFWKRIRSELLTQSTIHADETVLQVLKENGKPATSESRMWVYSSAKRADIQLRCFEYRESRSGKWARTFLEGFSGVLITDGYV